MVLERPATLLPQGTYSHAFVSSSPLIVVSIHLQNEAFEDPPPAADGGPVGGRQQFTPSVHGRTGNIAVSLNEATEWIVPPTLEAAAAVGIPYNQDGNSGDPLGSLCSLSASLPLSIASHFDCERNLTDE